MTNASWLGVQKSQRWFSWEDRLESHLKTAHAGKIEPGCRACADLKLKAAGESAGDGRNRPEA